MGFIGRAIHNVPHRRLRILVGSAEWAAIIMQGVAAVGTLVAVGVAIWTLNLQRRDIQREREDAMVGDYLIPLQDKLLEIRRFLYEANVRNGSQLATLSEEFYQVGRKSLHKTRGLKRLETGALLIVARQSSRLAEKYMEIAQAEINIFRNFATKLKATGHQVRLEIWRGSEKMHDLHQEHLIGVWLRRMSIRDWCLWVEPTLKPGDEARWFVKNSQIRDVSLKDGEKKLYQSLKEVIGDFRAPTLQAELHDEVQNLASEISKLLAEIDKAASARKSS